MVYWLCKKARQCLSGGVQEWSIWPVLKTVHAQAYVGSNPTPSAIISTELFSLGMYTYKVAILFDINFVWKSSQTYKRKDFQIYWTMQARYF